MAYLCFVSISFGFNKFLFISPSFKALTGYDASQFQAGSLPFWFSLIHPLDLPVVTGQITQAHQHLFSPLFDPSLPNALVLEYRFQRAYGQWIWIQETKSIVAFTPEGDKDKILVNLLDVTLQKDDQGQILKEQARNHPLLQMAAQYQAASNPQPLLATPLSFNRTPWFFETGAPKQTPKGGAFAAGNRFVY